VADTHGYREDGGITSKNAYAISPWHGRDEIASPGKRPNKLASTVQTVQIRKQQIGHAAITYMRKFKFRLRTSATNTPRMSEILKGSS